MISDALKPYAALIRIGLVLLAAAVLFGLGWKVGASHTESQLRSAQQKAEREYGESLERARDAERASYERLNEVSSDYQAELARLRDRPVDRSPVRLCVEAPRRASLSGAATAAGGSGATPAAGGVVQLSGGVDTQLRPGPDIGPALRRVARRADEVSAQGRGLQASAQPAAAAK